MTLTPIPTPLLPAPTRVGPEYTSLECISVSVFILKEGNLETHPTGREGGGRGGMVGVQTQGIPEYYQSSAVWVCTGVIPYTPPTPPCTPFPLQCSPGSSLTVGYILSYC